MASKNLRKDEETDEPAPGKEAEGQVVPECDEREDKNCCKFQVLGAAKRYVNVSGKGLRNPLS